MTNEITTVDNNHGDLVDQELFSGASVFDVERFEQIMRVAEVMARATTIPEHLKGKSNDPVERFEETRGNCFMICNQAANWGADPFAVAQSSAFVFGKIVLEGKLVRAVIRKKLGLDLYYRFCGDAGKMDRRVYASDKPMVDANGQPLSETEIKALMERATSRITVGTLGKWHTKNKSGGINDNWAKDEDKMFRERGAREWCREWAPGLMLGVYTPDEFDEIDHTIRSSQARDITRNPLLETGRTVAMETIDQKTGEILKTEVQRTAAATDSTNASSAKAASAKSASKDADRSGQSSTVDDSRSTNSSQGSAERGKDDASGKAETASPRLSAELLKKYASSLARMQTETNVERASAQFWQENGGAPKGLDRGLAKSIYDKQMARAKGDTDAEGLLDEINADIDTSFAGDAL